ncbi:MAG TPA: SusC/RagA family TonB-linked outer membrane protein, partial [Saprospiraceae bacterium]
MKNQHRLFLPMLLRKPYVFVILLLSSTQLLIAQNQGGNIPSPMVTGIVLDAADNSPLPGATVMLKGESVGTISDTDGHYQIKAETGDTLVFSFVGYIPVEIAVGQQMQIDALLAIDQAELDEVVVIGYGQEKRSNLTGSVSSVKVDYLKDKPINRLDQALQGMVSGVMVSKGGGAPGASPTIHIRGVGSIGNTEPLWIVDGIKMSPGNHFNLDDVESMEVLKDAASSAIYGAEAAHGVILVTTKRGAPTGKTVVTYSSSFAQVNPISLPTLLGSEDFVAYKKESRLNAGQNPEPAWDNWEHDTDWIPAFYAGSGFSHFHDLSIAKGADKSNFFLSLGYDNENGILVNNDFKRYSLRLNSDFELLKWLSVGESILLSTVKEDPINNNNEDYNGAIPYRSIPIMPIYDANNPYGGWGRAPDYFQGPNPVATQYQQHEDRRYNRLDGMMYLDIKPLKGLTVRGTIGYNTLSYLSQAFNEAFDYGAFANPINSLTYSSANDEAITGNVVGTYSLLTGNHAFKFMAGYESSQFETMHFNATATDFPIDVASSFNLATGTFNVTDRQSIYQRRLLSQFGRINYNYKEKYLLEANIRRDASAPAFSPENIWGVFPSISAGWNIAKESFMSDADFFTILKLRASIGSLGSDNIGNFIYSKTYTSQFDSYTFDVNGQNKVAGFYISRFPNAEVKWEEVQISNIGLDAAILDGRLSFSIEY